MHESVPDNSVNIAALDKVQTRRVWLTGILVVLVSLTVLASALALLFQAAVQREAANLSAYVDAQTTLIRAVARIDRNYAVTGEPMSLPARRLLDARRSFAAATDESRQIELLVVRERDGLRTIEVGTPASDAGSPRGLLLAQALAGEGGQFRGRDGQGHWVLMAARSLPEMGAAVLAVREVSDFAPPYLRAAAITCLATFLLAGAAAIYVGSAGRRMQRQLLASEAMLRSLFEGSPDAIFILNDRLEVVDCNKAATTMTGFPREAFIGRTTDQARPVYQPNGERTDKLLREALGFARSGRRMLTEISVERVGGKRLTVELSAAQIQVDRKTRFVINWRDITTRKKTTEELRQAEESLSRQREELAHAARVSAIGEMAAGIAHEINQPLTAVATYSDAAQRMLDDDATPRHTLGETLGKIGTQARRAAEVIERMRKFTRRDSDKLVQADLVEILREVIRLIETDCQRAGVALDVELPDYPLHVRVDRVQIQQVLLNMIRNAVEATQAAGADEAVQVRTSLLRDRRIEVAVDDAGSGVADHDVEKLFDPFFTTKSSGMGMGLSISHAIVEAHKGQLAYRPSRRGGAVFYFWLRLEDTGREAA